ncbi:MAG: hypothetical protein R3E50_10810 [Halioglobus sp.]
MDELQTSDSFVQSRLADWDVFDVRFVHKKNWQEKLGLAAEGALERASSGSGSGQGGRNY